MPGCTGPGLFLPKHLIEGKVNSVNELCYKIEILLFLTEASRVRIIVL